MTAAPDPWALPGLAGWLDVQGDLVEAGVLAVPTLDGLPAGWVDALLKRREGRLHPAPFNVTDGRPPAVVLAAHYGCAPRLEALADAGRDQELAVVSFAPSVGAAIGQWATFLARLHAARAAGSGGLSVLVPEAPDALCAPGIPVAADWRASLGRGDLVIWAEEHLPRDRDGVAAELAVSLAVELCGWRLDLAAALARAALADLAEPLAWLGRRREDPVAPPRADRACPLALHRDGRQEMLARRIWRAQLTALFPAIEEERLALVHQHRARLRVDAHLRELGVSAIEEIELGALHRQLKGKLDRAAADRLEALARIRNHLAHRRPADPADCLLVVRAPGANR